MPDEQTNSVKALKETTCKGSIILDININVVLTADPGLLAVSET